LTIEIPPEAVENEANEIARAMARTTRVPGFRPGRTPPAIIRARYRAEIGQELSQRLVSRYFALAVEEHKLAMVQHSERVEGGEHKDGEPMRFTVAFEVYPEIAIANYSGVPAPAVSATVEESEIEAQLKRMQEDRAELVPVEEERAIGAHDFVDISFRNIEGAGPEDGFPEKATVEVGGATTLQEFSDQLDGLRVGDEVTFPIVYREDYPAKQLAGRTIRFTVRAESIKQRQLPELTDEFAESVGPFKSMDDLRARIREDMESHKRERARQERRDGLLNWLENQNTFDVPETLVEHQAQNRMRKLARDFERRKIDPRGLDIDWVKLYEQQQRMALRDVKGTLILDHIAGVEKLDATDEEVQREIERISRETEQPPQKVYGLLRKNSGIEQLKTDIQRRKTLDLIEERALPAA
jgi:trigger factor